MANNKKYNFKGLDEIFGDSVSDLVSVIGEGKSNENNQVDIDINLLISNPYQPRKKFNESELEELAQSISTNGLIQPVIVSKNNSNYYIIAGERRVKASKIAGLTKIPAVVLNITDRQMEEYALIENIQRVDLLDIEEAIAYKKLMLNGSLTQEQLSQKVGKSRSHIANTMRLLNLPDFIQENLINRKLTMGQAKPLLSIMSKPELLKEIVDKIIEKNLTVREVENLVKNINKVGSNKNLKINIQDPNKKNIENKMIKKFGTKVSISDSKISIHYSGNDDLNRILEILDLIGR